MKIEQVLGVIGGVFGILSAFFAIGFGGFGKSLNLGGAETIIGLGVSAFIFSIVGLIGGAIADKRAKTGGVLMIIAGICGFISISLFYLVAGPFFLIGGILALLHSRRKKVEPKAKEIVKEAKTKFCLECGAKIDGKPKFCPECGNKLV